MSSYYLAFDSLTTGHILNSRLPEIMIVKPPQSTAVRLPRQTASIAVALSMHPSALQKHPKYRSPQRYAQCPRNGQPRALKGMQMEDFDGSHLTRPALATQAKRPVSGWKSSRRPRSMCSRMPARRSPWPRPRAGSLLWIRAADVPAFPDPRRTERFKKDVHLP